MKTDLLHSFHPAQLMSNYVELMSNYVENVELCRILFRGGGPYMEIEAIMMPKA